MSEEWKAIPGFEGFYEVSDLGRVRSVDRRVRSARGRGYWVSLRGTILAPGALPSGHLHVSLKKDWTRSNRQVHRLVLEAFVGSCPEGMEACHEDGDPTNNDLRNLRWDSRSANQQDAVRHGTHSSTQKTACPKGHPYSLENTYMNGRSRACRECGRESARNYWRRMQALRVAAREGGAA